MPQRRLATAAIAVALIGAACSTDGSEAPVTPSVTAAPTTTTSDSTIPPTPSTTPPAPTTTTLPPTTTTAPSTTATGPALVETTTDGARVVRIENSAFHPAQLVLDLEEFSVVQWRNEDDVAYTILSNERDRSGDRLFESDAIEPTGTFEVDFSKWEPASHNYFALRGNARLPGIVDTRPERLARASRDVSPVAALDSFEAHALFSVSFGQDEGFEFDTQGIAAGNDLWCAVKTRFGGLEVEQTVTVVDDVTWVDLGDGFEESLRSVGAAFDLLSLCPAAEEFYVDFGSLALLLQDGEPDSLGNLETRRYDLSEFAQAIAPGFLGLSETGEAVRTIYWLADPGGWIAGIDLEITFPAEFLDEAEALPLADPDSDVTVVLFMTVSSPDDPGLTVVPVTVPAEA